MLFSGSEWYQTLSWMLLPLLGMEHVSLANGRWCNAMHTGWQDRTTPSLLSGCFMPQLLKNQKRNQRAALQDHEQTRHVIAVLGNKRAIT
jgi:hypothetical protein